MVTQEYLKEVLDYNPETGAFIWKVCNKRRVKIGDIAGSLQPNGRGQIKIKGKYYLIHRLVWLYTHGEFPIEDIDHVDGNPSNNRLANLRACTHKDNMKNYKIPSSNTSGFKGVNWSKRDSKWRAQGTLKGRRKHLGLFLTPEEASKAYNDFCKQHHGEFYRDTTKENQNEST